MMIKHIAVKFIVPASIMALTLIMLNAALFLYISNDTQQQQEDFFLEHLQNERELQAQLLHDNLTQKGRSLANFIARNAYKHLVNYDYDFLEKMRVEAERDPDIRFVDFKDTDGKYFIDGEHYADAHLSQKIVSGDDWIGVVEVGLNFSSVEKNTAEVTERINNVVAKTLENQSANTNNLAKVVLLSALIEVIILCVVIYLALSRIIVSPLNHVTEIIRAVSKGELKQHIRIRSSDEIGILANAFQTMREDLFDLLSNVRMALENVTSSSHEVSTNAARMSRRASTQAAAIAEISATMNKMVSNISQNADNARHTEKIASTAAEKVQSGKKTVAEAVASMDRIAKKSMSIADIAQQTYMLSLNASIEASKADEQNQGFSVIAAEVRSLADRTGRDAKEIIDLVHTGSQIVETSHQLLETLVPDIQKTADLVKEIRIAGGEQSASVEQVEIAIQQLEDVMRKNTIIYGELATVAQDLANQAKETSSKEIMVNLRF